MQLRNLAMAGGLLLVASCSQTPSAPDAPSQTPLTATAASNTNAHIKAYGDFDPMLILQQSDTEAGKRYSLDLSYLDAMVKDLTAHAGGYPTQFASAGDKARATQDAYTLARMLEPMISAEQVNVQLLYWYARINDIGHNLDIAGAHAKADASYTRLLALAPDNAQLQYTYGNFLAGSGNAARAIAPLQKAQQLGLVDAGLSLAMAHLTLDNQAAAIDNLERYLKVNPDDAQAAKLVQALRSDKPGTVVRVARATGSPDQMLSRLPTREPSPLDDINPTALTGPLTVRFRPDIARSGGVCDAKQELSTTVEGVTFTLMNLAESRSEQCPQLEFPAKVHMHYLFAAWYEEDGRHQTQLMLRPYQLPAELQNWVLNWDGSPDTSALDGRDLVNVVMSLPIRHDQAPFTGKGDGYFSLHKNRQDAEQGFMAMDARGNWRKAY